MLDATRLRTPCLFDKIVSADEAATLITDGMNVGVSGFTPSGYPKKTTLALAKAIKAAKMPYQYLERCFRRTGNRRNTCRSRRYQRTHALLCSLQQNTQPPDQHRQRNLY